MSTGRDLRATVAQLRAGNAMFAPKPGDPRTAPVDTGERLATLERSDSEQVRVSWAEYEGKPFLSIRLWTRGADGQWWPDKTKGITVRVRELATFAEGVAAALEKLEDMGRAA
jgi:hypothetical protein